MCRVKHYSLGESEPLPKPTHNPWKTLSCKQQYDNPWITVTEAQVLNPAGNPTIYGVTHFKNKAVGILPIDSERNTWLVGQYRYALNEYSWEIPMGGCPLNETTAETALRELQEETGLVAKKLCSLMTLHPSNSVTDELGEVFIATDLCQSDSNAEESEQLMVIKLPLQRAIELTLEGQITDAISVAALLKIAIIGVENL